MGKQGIGFNEFGLPLSVRMSKKFYELIRKKLMNTNKSMISLCEFISLKTTYSKTYIKNVLKPSNTYMVPWIIVMQLTEILDFSIDLAESFIVSYGVSRCRSPVLNPKLPVRHTPIMDMLIAHALADGSVVRSKGRMPYFSFRQHDKLLMDSYKKQCEFVFGSISSLYVGSEETKTYLPAGPSQLLFLVSKKSENGFLSTTAIMPEYILSLPLENQFAFLLAFFADEGHVDSTNLVIRLKNKSLTDGLFMICKNLGFAVTKTSYTNGMHQVYINSTSLSLFYQMYIDFQKTYSFVNLSYKEHILKQALYRKNNSSLRLDRKRQLLDFFKDSPRTVNELARLAVLTRQGVRYHIKTLMKHRRIRHIDTIPGKPPEYVYAIWE